ncbi:hypothetical protein AO366_0656 [Moraxella catarrhalis]|nr:hypothetical protein AO380_0233 [Moraxella catarrhalis]OAV13474.1 hypothetical protein AO376_1653 [Moraxella catarrhalis]OAV19011.1 hypothetical protein AO374_0830 [Moraxella catarrhalis]OAV25795.1 hypothetical protein AO371_0590 [Moraxella catarrhalis]OAV30164.1 hypothetical protein AO367_1396 [Moraxella catarrhalis]
MGLKIMNNTLLNHHWLAVFGKHPNHRRDKFGSSAYQKTNA